MNETKLPVVRGMYRVDLRSTPALLSTHPPHRVLLRDVPVGTKFTTQGSTQSLRGQLDIRHACHLTLCFEEKGAAYFCRENGENIEIAACGELRLIVVDVPGTPH